MAPSREARKTAMVIPSPRFPSPSPSRPPRAVRLERATDRAAAAPPQTPRTPPPSRRRRPSKPRSPAPPRGGAGDRGFDGLRLRDGGGVRGVCGGAAAARSVARSNRTALGGRDGDGQGTRGEGMTIAVFLGSLLGAMALGIP